NGNNRGSDGYFSAMRNWPAKTIPIAPAKIRSPTPTRSTRSLMALPGELCLVLIHQGIHLLNDITEVGTRHQFRIHTEIILLLDVLVILEGLGESVGELRDPISWHFRSGVRIDNLVDRHDIVAKLGDGRNVRKCGIAAIAEHRQEINGVAIAC